MVRLRCADRLGASAYPVCRVGRKRRTEGCRAWAVRDGETAFSRDASEALERLRRAFLRGMPPGMCGEASIREYGEYHCRMPSGSAGKPAAGRLRGFSRNDGSGLMPGTEDDNACPF